MNRFLSNPSANPARSGRRIVMLLTALLTGWLVSGTVNAAEAAEAAEAADASEAEQSATSKAESDASPKTDQTENDQATSSSEVFIPTEDISEDFAVSFPVDI